MSTPTPAKKTAMTLEQRRSQAAWRYAQEGVEKSEQYKKYKVLTKAAPALIMNNGLMQTLAFYESKKEAHYQELASQLRRWIKFFLDGSEQDPTFAPLMEKLLKSDSSTYRQATEEALLLLRWIRQFAAALGG